MAGGTDTGGGSIVLFRNTFCLTIFKAYDKLFQQM
jgi:hypothetical protein